MTVVPLDDSDVQRVLCVAAHPDDLDFGASGTVAAWTKAGVEVTYLLCTRGDQGGFDETPRELMPAIREQEQRDAAAAAGLHDVRFLDGFSDGWLEPNHDLQRAIVRVIRQVRPQRMLIQSPDAIGNASAPATPTTSPPARRPSAPSTPPPGTRSLTPSCSPTRASSPGSSPRCG